MRQRKSKENSQIFIHKVNNLIIARRVREGRRARYIDCGLENDVTEKELSEFSEQFSQSADVHFFTLGDVLGNIMWMKKKLWRVKFDYETQF